MICESCGNTYDDNLTVCPVCGVSAAQSLANPDLQTVSQTVPPFVRRLGAEPEVKPEPAPAHGADTQPFLTKSYPESQPAVDANEELKTSPAADYPNHYDNTGPSEKVNAAANLGFFMGILFFVFNIVVLIFSLTGVGDKIYDISAYEFFVMLPYWIISLVGVIICINNKASRPRAIVGIMLCITNTIIYAVMFKYILAPYYIDQILNAFSPPMPQSLGI